MRRPEGSSCRPVGRIGGKYSFLEPLSNRSHALMKVQLVHLSVRKALFPLAWLLGARYPTKVFDVSPLETHWRSVYGRRHGAVFVLEEKL